MTENEGTTIAAVVVEHDESIESLRSRVDALEGSAQGSQPADRVDFDDWVAWFAETYLVEEVPETWESVPGVREELVALHAAWCAAYSDYDEPLTSFEAVYWHDARIRTQSRIENLYARWQRRTVARA